MPLRIPPSLTHHLGSPHPSLKPIFKLPARPQGVVPFMGQRVTTPAAEHVLGASTTSCHI